VSERSYGLAWVMVASSLVGCPPAQGVESLKDADVDIYAADVHAYVSIACGALNCHGNAGRPLRIYSELGLRIDPMLRQHPVDQMHPAVTITQEELQDNVIAFSTVSPLSAGLQHFALQKPLAGGVDHVGGKIFESTQAPGYLCLRAWLVPDESKKVDAATSCAAALATLGF